MAGPVDSARPTTSISTANTTHAINVGSPTAGQLLVVLWRAAAAPGTVTFTGYTSLNGSAGDATDASDDSTFIFYRWADGTEGATDNLTTVNSVKSAAICWVINGAENPATQAPERSTVQVFTTVANTANPTIVTPTGGTKNYMFIAMAGIDQEATTFSALTNYTNLVNANSGTAGVVATNCIIGGGTRNVQASSEDPGAFTHGAAATGGCSYVVAIHPMQYGVTTQALLATFTSQGTIDARLTGVAQISLAPGGTPATRTSHVINVKARTTTGSTGTINAALYQDGVNISGNLQSSALTTTLTTKSLAVPDASAALITGYQDLEIRVWGSNVGGGALVYEVSELSLSIPGAVSFPAYRPRPMIRNI